MQEKNDYVPNDRKKRRYTTKEEQQVHVENLQKSSLSMREYCQQNNLSLASLSEWKRKLLPDKSKFKPIQLLSSDGATKPSNIIEIIVNQHIKIRIQHVTDVSLVVSIAKGLAICS